MLLDKKQLLYELFLVLDHALMLVLVILHEQHSFIIQIAYKLLALINFHFFLVKMVNHYVNHVILKDIQYLLEKIANPSSS